MEDVTLADAKQRLDELVARAAKGEDVRIVAPKAGSVRLLPVDASVDSLSVAKTKREPGRWAERLPTPPEGFFDPLSEEELQHWYGDDK